MPVEKNVRIPPAGLYFFGGCAPGESIWAPPKENSSRGFFWVKLEHGYGKTLEENLEWNLEDIAPGEKLKLDIEFEIIRLVAESDGARIDKAEWAKYGVI